VTPQSDLPLWAAISRRTGLIDGLTVMVTALELRDADVLLRIEGLTAGARPVTRT
jgi:hypothetical protein